MYDFLSFVRDTGVEVKILPPGAGVLIRLEVRESEHGFYERREKQRNTQIGTRAGNVRRWKCSGKSLNRQY